MKEHKGLLITEDKDFGELVFAHDIRDVSILFMRFVQPNYLEIEESFSLIISKFVSSEVSGFITLTKNKIRIRTI